MSDTIPALTAKAWPYEEARKILKRIEKTPPQKSYILLETGYGPSGLPHIGTFGEVVRTSMVRAALQEMTDIPVKLIAFSDDMDGLRKVPTNLPNQHLMQPHIGKPLTQVPDPFGTHESFGAHNNARLCAFLDQFGFDYDFRSSTECYTSGQFDAALIKILHNYDKIIKIILPTLGEERRKTYSPFLPISPSTGEVLQVPILEQDLTKNTVIFEDVDGTHQEVTVTGGACKLQWKVDWGMRWYALDVDYEMSGKDLIDSVRLSSKIVRTLGAQPPESLTYEHFLDDQGQKISKSVGNGVSIEEWLRYGTEESLSYFMYHAPKRAKRLFFDVIPKATDEYLTFLSKYPTQTEAEKLENPVHHLHSGDIENINCPVSFSMLLNLAAACNPENGEVLWGFISRYAEDASPEKMPYLAKLIEKSVKYYHDFVKPQKTYRLPTEIERQALEMLSTRLSEMSDTDGAEAFQALVFEMGRTFEFDPMRDWFKCLYQVLLGQSQGPRFGSFIALYGRQETIQLIKTGLSGDLILP